MPNQTPPFYAHSVAGQCQPTPQWQLLRDHLKSVANLAGQFAQKTGVADLPAAAEAAGWLHDLGKYRETFQRYIRGLPPMGSKQHKEAGAAWTAKAGNLPLSFAILGHHGGIPDTNEAMTAVRGPDGLAALDELQARAISDCPELNGLAIAKRGDATTTTEIFTRLLLSCLVDADWTDTSEHERSYKNWPHFPAPPALDPAPRLLRLLTFISQRAETIRANNPILASIREGILNACAMAAELPPGMFTLTVPTGGGKTLSGLAFALKHADAHGLRRIIYVAPYISILEQNAEVIRAALGVTDRDQVVFEHQSLADPQGPQFADVWQTSAAARRAENWDSSVIVTTNVQFFESLFSNRPGRCRKLHNIAKSVVILDECQSLPPDLVKPTCQMLKQLTGDLGCTVVLCTATQPAFDHETLKEHRLAAKEIIPGELKLFEQLKRVQLKWPTKREERLSWPEVASRMIETPSALCIVNTKAAALALFAELKHLSRHVYHLSTSMCPAHRTAILATVKERLEAKELVFVVSTQLIEAGVDIDFPCVFREMAPLEAVIQAAGRCNREGHIPEAGGQVVVFRSIDGEKKIPNGWYRRGRDVLESAFLAAGQPPRIDSIADIRDYFGHLYWTGDLDPLNIVGMRSGLKFESCANAYRLIDSDTVPVVVATWKDEIDPGTGLNWWEIWREMRLRQDPGCDVRSIEDRLAALLIHANRSNYRALAPFLVNVFRTELPRLPKGMVLPLSEEVELLVWHGKYDPAVGRLSEFQDLIEAI